GREPVEPVAGERARKRGRPPGSRNRAGTGSPGGRGGEAAAGERAAGGLAGPRGGVGRPAGWPRPQAASAGDQDPKRTRARPSSPTRRSSDLGREPVEPVPGERARKRGRPPGSRNRAGTGSPGGRGGEAAAGERAAGGLAGPRGGVGSPAG